MADVKFQLEYEADDGGVREMIGSLKALDGGTVKLARGMGHLEDTTRRAAKAQREMSKGGLNNWIGDIKGKLSSIKNMQAFQLVSQGVGLAKDGIEAASAAVMGFTRTLAATERRNTSLGQMLGVNESKEVLGFIERIGTTTEFTGGQLGDFAQSLARAGMAARDMPSAVAAGLDVAAMSGSGLEGLKQFQQGVAAMAGSGQVSDDLFKLLGQGAGGTSGKTDFFAALSARTGLGVERLTALLGEGKVKMQDSLEAFYAVITQRTGGDLGAAGVKAGEGLEATLTHLSDLPDRFIRQLAGGDMSGKLTGLFDKILTLFAPGSPMEKAIGSGLVKMIDLAVMAIELLPAALEKAAVFTGPLIEGYEALWDIVKSIWPVIQPLAVGLGSMFVGALKLTAWVLGLVADAIGLLVPLVVPLADLIGGTVAALGALVGLIPTALSAAKDFAVSLWSSFTGFFDRFYNFGSEIVSGLVSGIGDSIGEAVKSVEDLGGQVMGTLKSMLGIASPSKVFAEFGRMTGLGFSGGLEAEMPRIDAAVSKTFDLSAPMPKVSASASAGGSASIGDVHINITEPGASAQDIAATVTQTLMAKLQSLSDGFYSEVPA